jgi:uncharacterized OB-fold protein
LSVCPRCQSTDRQWSEAPALGRVFSFTWAYTAAHPGISDAALPYNIAVIEFPDLPGVRLISNVVDATPDELAIDDEVRLIWEQVSDQWLPRFAKHP